FRNARVLAEESTHTGLTFNLRAHESSRFSTDEEEFLKAGLFGFFDNNAAGIPHRAIHEGHAIDMAHRHNQRQRGGCPHAHQKVFYLVNIIARPHDGLPCQSINGREIKWRGVDREDFKIKRQILIRGLFIDELIIEITSATKHGSQPAEARVLRKIDEAFHRAKAVNP